MGIEYKSHRQNFVFDLIAMDNLKYQQFNSNKISDFALLEAAIKYNTSKCLHHLLKKVAKDEIIQALVIAAKHGNTKTFKIIANRAIALKIDFKDKVINSEGQTLAHVAAHYQRHNIINAILKMGFNLEIRDKNNQNVADIASKNNDLKTLNLFKKYKVQSNHESQTNLVSKEKSNIYPELDKKKADYILSSLKHSSLKQLRLATNLNNVHTVINGKPLLHLALSIDVLKNNFAIQAVKLLANKKFDPLQKDNFGNPLCFILLKCNDLNEINQKLNWLKQAFLNQYNDIINQVNDDGKSLVDMALESKYIHIIEALSGTNSKSNIHSVVMSDNIEVISKYVTNQTDIDEPNNSLTPLMQTAKFGRNNAAKFLLMLNANPYLTAPIVGTALHLAIDNGHIQTALAIIDFMPNCDIPNENGITPLMLAVIKNEPLLIERIYLRSNPYKYNTQGLNAMHLAALFNSSQALEKLIHLGMDIEIGTISKKLESDLTPAHFAASNNSLESLNLLFKANCNRDYIGSKGSTIIHSLIQANSEGMYNYLIRLPQFFEKHDQNEFFITAAKYGNIRVLRLLYIRGIDLEHFDKHGLHAIHYAVINKQFESVSLLNEWGVSADLLTLEINPRSSIDIAAKANHINIENLLKQNLNQSKNVAMAFDKKEKTLPPKIISVKTTPAPFNPNQLNIPERNLITKKFAQEVNLAFLSLALEVKDKLGISVFRSVISCNADIELVSEAMTLMLEINDESEITKLWQPPNPQKSIDNLKLRYDQILLAKYPESSREELIKKFVDSTNLKYPLSIEEVEVIARQYDRILFESKKLKSVSSSNLINSIDKDYNLINLIAVIREGVIKIFDKCPYNTQIFILLGLINCPQTTTLESKNYPQYSKGRVAQVATGDGKSLDIAMLALYYAIQGKYVDIITTSHSLAMHANKTFQPLFELFGIKSSTICTKHPTQQDFKAKIIFGTIADFEFALLRQLAFQDNARFALGSERPMQVAIVDEADSFLIDQTLNSARIAVPKLQNYNWIYKPYLEIIKQSSLFNLNQIKQVLGKINPDLPNDNELENLYNVAKQALRYNEGLHYVIKKGKIIIVDYDNTGHLIKGSRWNGGLHAFLEAKHNLEIIEETLTFASVSHLALLNQYQIILALTGTLGDETEANEIKTLYKLDFFSAPSHLPNKAVKFPSIICEDKATWCAAMIQSINAALVQNRPVLVLLQTINDSIEFSQELNRRDVKNQLFNAVQQEDEKHVLLNAGQCGTVTVATNTAGRGTDIILSSEAKNNGGLHCLLGFLSNNLRVELQGRGRAARQGQPGSSQVIVCRSDPRVKMLTDRYNFRNNA